MAQAIPFRWQSASCSHVGRVRRINEDALLDRPERGLWAVADGMGGHTLGDVASRMVVDALAQLTDADAGDIRRCLGEVNRRLMTEAAMRDVQLIG
ncbi:MAG: serine/threonine-protein phosphatase, partial [Oxalobacteraceae bacterium]